MADSLTTVADGATLPVHFRRGRTALVIIDMQRDFVEPGGFGEALGNDVRPLAAIVPMCSGCWRRCRARGLTVVHTREAHRPTCPTARRPSACAATPTCASATTARWAAS